MDTALLPQKEWISAKKQWQKTENKTRLQIKRQDFVLKFVAAFQNDFTVEEACDYSGISRDTFYRWVRDDAEFAKQMEQAKRFPMLRAKQRGFQIIDKGSDRDAGPMIRWLLEKRQPSIYMPSSQEQKANATQNNYFFLNNEQLSVLTKQPDIASSDPTELLKALEAKQIVDTRTEEKSIT